MIKPVRCFYILILAAAAALFLCPAASAGIFQPAETAYTMSIAKLVLVAMLFAAGFYACNWIAGDLERIMTEPLWWRLGAIGALVVSTLAVFLIPAFHFGYLLGILILAGVVAAYSRYRNRLLPPKLSVFTRAHLHRLRDRLAGRKIVEEETGPVVPMHPVVFMTEEDMPIRHTGETEEALRAEKLTRELFQNALGRRATEIGLASRPGSRGRVRFRVDGVVVDGGTVPRDEITGIFAEVKRMAGLDAAEFRKPQAGRFKVVMAGRNFDARVRTSGSVRGEKVRINLIDTVEAKRRLSDIGMSERQISDVTTALDAAKGLVLVSAPINSGLTSTMHAMLQHFDRYVKTVVALEPEVNVEVDNVRHLEIPSQTIEEGGVARQLEVVLRNEPDVVMLDGMVDAAVANLAVKAARERLVIFGLQALDVGQVLSRFIGIVQDRNAVAEVLSVVVNQRLARQLCRQCREPYRPRPEFLRKANLTKQSVDVLYRVPREREVSRGKVVVCPACQNVGFVGRVSFFEVMPIDARARQMIEAGAAMPDIRVYTRKRGVRSLQEAGLQRVIEGATSVDEVLRVIQQPS